MFLNHVNDFFQFLQTAVKLFADDTSLFSVDEIISKVDKDLWRYMIGRTTAYIKHTALYFVF